MALVDPTLVLAAVVGLILLLLLRCFAQPWFRLAGALPPGSMGWPFLGETLQLRAAYCSSNPEPFADSRCKRYGRIFKTHLLGKPTIFSADPETNKFILQNEGKLFASNYPQSVTNLLGRSALVSTHGELHKKLYSLTWNFTHSSVIKDRLMHEVENLVCMNLESWSDRTVYVQDEAKKITFDFSVSQLLSASPGEWTENLRQEYLHVINGFLSLPIRFPGTSYNKAIKARKRVARDIREQIAKRRTQGSAKHHDMLDLLLQENAFSAGILSDEQIVDMVISMLVAAYEATSVIMTLAVKFLTENPEVLQELRREHFLIKNEKEGNGKLEWTDYKAMTSTQSVITETLRMGNIITGAFRRALQDVDIKGYTIPKGWVVFTSFRAVHMDEDFYADAKKFDPWRWKGTNSCNINSSITFTPFGGGSRFCPGYEFARMQISIFLHHLVTKFSWEAAEDDMVIYFPTTRMVKRYPIAVKKFST